MPHVAKTEPVPSVTNSCDSSIQEEEHEMEPWRYNINIRGLLPKHVIIDTAAFAAGKFHHMDASSKYWLAFTGGSLEPSMLKKLLYREPPTWQ